MVRPGPTWSSKPWLAALSGLVLAGCAPAERQVAGARRVVTDMLGRQVAIPRSVERIVAHRSGMLRLVVWMDAADLVCAIEENERRRRVPYLYARPELRQRPVIGGGNLVDPELLAALAPDLLLATYLTGEQADRLQARTGVPVLVVRYGNFDQELETFFDSLRFLGDVLDRADRARFLIAYVQATISDLERRVAGLPEPRPQAYIGGVAFSGAQGLTSTEPRYPAFLWLGIENVARSVWERLPSIGSTKINAFIDKEQLIEWDPEYLFLDLASPAASAEALLAERWTRALRAVRAGKVFTVLPYVWNAPNFSTILVNGYFIGKFVFPERFADIDPETKADEIYQALMGAPILRDLLDQYGPSRRLFEAR